jgi:hypothetical protein
MKVRPRKETRVNSVWNTRIVPISVSVKVAMFGLLCEVGLKVKEEEEEEKMLAAARESDARRRFSRTEEQAAALVQGGDRSSEIKVNLTQSIRRTPMKQIKGICAAFVKHFLQVELETTASLAFQAFW